MTEIDRNNLINKFLVIEQWAHRAARYIETMDRDKLCFACKRIKHDIKELEVELGVEE